MYHTFSQMREGWTKNFALLFPSPGRLAAKRGGEFAALAAGTAIAAAATFRGQWPVALTSALCTAGIYLQFRRRIRRAHFSRDAELAALFGLPVFAYLLLASARAHARGEVTWKGRTYSSPPAQVSRMASGAGPA